MKPLTDLRASPLCLSLSLCPPPAPSPLRLEQFSAGSYRVWQTDEAKRTALKFTTGQSPEPSDANHRQTRAFSTFYSQCKTGDRFPLKWRAGISENLSGNKRVTPYVPATYYRNNSITLTKYHITCSVPLLYLNYEQGMCVLSHQRIT